MTYAALLEREGINSQFLVVMKPRRKPGSFTVFAGSVYSVSFTHGEVRAVESDGVALTLGVSTSLSAGEFYYDVTTSTLYVRTSGSDNPNTHFIVATYEIHVSTFDAHWYRDPLDSATRVVYYEPLISKSPVIDQNMSSSLFGYMPVNSTSITLSNVTDFFTRHVYDSSFNQAEVSVYHYLDELTVANTKLLLRGVMGSPSYTDQEVSISVLDRLDIFDKEFRNYSGASFFATSSFAGLDQNYQARPIRYVYGRVEGVVPVNIDYVGDAPTTSDNRDWVVMNGQSNLANLSTTVPAAPASTTTRTYLTSASGFRVGDQVWLDRAVGTDAYVLVTVVNYASNYIEHAAIASPLATGDTVKRAFVGDLLIEQQGNLYRAFYGRDWLPANFADNTVGFSFNTSLEANVGLPSTLSVNDKLSCLVYGHKNANTLGGPAFGSDEQGTGSLCHPVVILYELLKTGLGITEAEIDTATFTALEASIDSRIAMSIPHESGGDFPLYRDIISEILQSELLRIHIDNDGKWTLSQVAPMGAVTKSIDDTEILEGDFSYDFSYDELVSDVIVEYNAREVADTLGVTGNTGKVKSVLVTNTNAKYLHKITKQTTVRSLHFEEADAQVLADHLSFYLGERIGTVSITTKNRFFDTLINDVIQVSRVRLPGYELDETIERTRKLSVTQTSRGLTDITISLDDQKGIEDNSGSW